MQKTLRFLGLVAVIGAFAIVVAQSSARAKVGSGQGTDGAAFASKQSSSYANQVLTLMSQYFTFKHNMEIDRAKEAGRNDRIDPIIHVNCAAVLWLQTPDQQEKTVASWEIEKYRPNDAKWSEIARSPSLVRFLVTVSKETNAKVAGYIDEVWAPIMNQDKEFNARFIRSDAYKNAKSQDEINRAHYEGMKVWRQSHPLPPLAERQKATLARYEKALSDTVKLLNAPQRKEMGSLRSKFEVALRTAVNGDRP